MEIVMDASENRAHHFTGFCAPFFERVHHLRMTEFSALALIGPLQRGLKEVGYGQMTPVQASSLPAILAGRDVVAQARTGSGKTAAFALGLLSALDASSKLHGLVLVPPREL